MNRIELLELVKQHHAHMGEVEILKLINRALDDFTTETGILKEYVDVQNTVAGQRYYTVDKCINIVNVWIDDILIPRIASVNTAMLIDDDEHQDALWEFNSKPLFKALNQAISYFESTEEYERCAFLVKVKEMKRALERDVPL